MCIFYTLLLSFYLKQKMGTISDAHLPLVLHTRRHSQRRPQCSQNRNQNLHNHLPRLFLHTSTFLLGQSPILLNSTF